MRIGEDDVRAIAAKAGGPNFVKVLRHFVEPYFEHRSAGMNGDFYSLRIDFSTSTTTTSYESRKFFVKTPAESSSTMREFVDPEVSREEFEFFERVYPLLMRNYETEAAWSAECYLVKGAELLVLEDLGGRGYASRASSLYDAELMPAALRTLARFHGSSIILAEREGSPDRLFPELFREKTYTDFGANGRANKLGFETLALLAERFRLAGARDLMPRIWELAKEIVQPIKGGCNVICHADLWRTNVLFNNEPTGATADCRLVDYQMLRYASPCTDVAMMMYVHTSREFRRHSELKMLDHYIASLLELLEKHRVSKNLPSREQLYDDYRRCRLFGKVCVAVRWPRLVFKSVLRDPVALESWYKVTRIDVYQKCIDEDPSYREELRETLEELLDEARGLLS